MGGRGFLTDGCRGGPRLLLHRLHGGEGQGGCDVGLPVPCPALCTVTAPHQSGWPFPRQLRVLESLHGALFAPHPACKAQMW